MVMETMYEQIKAARGLRDALAHRIAIDAIYGKLPSQITIALYSEYTDTERNLHKEIHDAAKGWK